MSFVSAVPTHKLNIMLETSVEKDEVDRCGNQIINGCLRNSRHKQVF